MKKHTLFGISILFSFLLGAFAMWGYQTYTRQLEANNYGFLNDPFDKSFFSPSSSPFEDIQRMSEQMDKFFDHTTDFPGYSKSNDFNKFNSLLSPGLGDQALIKIRTEDDDMYLYYVLDIEDKELTNFNIETAGGYVSLNAELGASSRNMSLSQTINQRFKIPADVDPDSIKVEQLDEEVRVRFTKQG